MWDVGGHFLGVLSGLCAVGFEAGRNSGVGRVHGRAWHFPSYPGGPRYLRALPREGSLVCVLFLLFLGLGNEKEEAVGLLQEAESRSRSLCPSFPRECGGAPPGAGPQLRPPPAALP